MYLVFTRMPGESYRRRLRSLLLFLSYVFRALINSLLCWFCTSAVGLVLFQISVLKTLHHAEELLYVHRNRRLIKDGSPRRPPRLSHNSWALGNGTNNPCSHSSRLQSTRTTGCLPFTPNIPPFHARLVVPAHLFLSVACCVFPARMLVVCPLEWLPVSCSCTARNSKSFALVCVCCGIQFQWVHSYRTQTKFWTEVSPQAGIPPTSDWSIDSDVVSMETKQFIEVGILGKEGIGLETWAMRAQVKKAEKIEAVLTFVQNIVSAGTGAIRGACPCPFFFFLFFFHWHVIRRWDYADICWKSRIVQGSRTSYNL